MGWLRVMTPRKSEGVRGSGTEVSPLCGPHGSGVCGMATGTRTTRSGRTRSRRRGPTRTWSRRSSSSSCSSSPCRSSATPTRSALTGCPLSLTTAAAVDQINAVDRWRACASRPRSSSSGSRWTWPRCKRSEPGEGVRGGLHDCCCMIRLTRGRSPARRSCESG